MIDNSTEQLVVIDSSPKAWSPLKVSNEEASEKDEDTDQSLSHMHFMMNKRAAEKFGVKPEHNEKIAGSENNKGMIKGTKQVVGETLRTKLQREQAKSPAPVTPAKGPKSDMYPLMSPNRLEQEEIDRIVDQIVA